MPPPNRRSLSTEEAARTAPRGRREQLPPRGTCPRRKPQRRQHGSFCKDSSGGRLRRHPGGIRQRAAEFANRYGNRTLTARQHAGSWHCAVDAGFVRHHGLRFEPTRHGEGPLVDPARHSRRSQPGEPERSVAPKRPEYQRLAHHHPARSDAVHHIRHRRLLNACRQKKRAPVTTGARLVSSAREASHQREGARQLAALRFTLLSATVVSFLSAAFSSSRVFCRIAAASSRPS